MPEKFMKAALKEAQKACEKLEVPVGVDGVDAFGVIRQAGRVH